MSVLLPTDRNVIIIIGSILATVVLFILFYKIRKCMRLPKQPLPPKRPLVFERSRTTPDTPASDFTRFPAKTRSAIGLQDIRHHPSPFLNVNTNLNISTVDESIAPLGTDQSLEPATSSPGQKKNLPRKPSTASIATSSIKSRADSAHSRRTSFRGVPHRQPMNIVLPRPLAPLRQSPPNCQIILQ